MGRPANDRGALFLSGHHQYDPHPGICFESCEKAARWFTFQNKYLNFENGRLTVGDKYSRIGARAFENCENVKFLTVSNHVEQIGKGAFEGCSHIEDICVPFVGESSHAEPEKAVLGYIFGYDEPDPESTSQTVESIGFLNEQPAEKDGRTWQYSIGYPANDEGKDSRVKRYYYFIPETLTSVTITKQTMIPMAAFNGCKNIKTITLPKNYTLADDYSVFQNCRSLGPIEEYQEMN